MQKVRQLAASLSEQDKGFWDLRVKIHGSPDPGDAELVRDYAAKTKNPAKYLELADEIDSVYSARPRAPVAGGRCKNVQWRTLAAEITA